MDSNCLFLLYSTSPLSMLDYGVKKKSQVAELRKIVFFFKLLKKNEKKLLGGVDFRGLTYNITYISWSYNRRG